MISTTSISVIAAAFLFGKTALAANATTVSATGCIDPSSMNSCLQSVDDQLSKCVDEAGGNDEELIGCQWEEWLQQMVCYQASCWNKAYSCEYQYLVTEYKSQRTVDESIPFYPAPDNAPGGCSCSLGQVYANFTANLNQLNNCQQYTTTVSDDLTICECCGYSAASSAFYGICPNTSPDGLGFFQSGSQYESVAGSCAGLTADVCANYGFYSADNGTFLDPINLPGGTEPLSTTAGPSSLTTPPAGATITWSALSQVFTVTAAPYNAKNVASGGTAAGTATAAATATATRTGTAAGTTGSSGSETSATGTAAGVTSGGSQTTATGAAKTGAASSIRKGHNSWAIIGMLSVGGLMAML